MAKYLIWSEEHGKWWAPGKWGYTGSIVRAGRYEKDQAEKIVDDANIVLKTISPFNEIAIPDPLDEGQG